MLRTLCFVKGTTTFCAHTARDMRDFANKYNKKSLNKKSQNQKKSINKEVMNPMWRKIGPMTKLYGLRGD